MGIKFSRKMDSFQTSIFNELSSYKKQKLQDGQEIIDLSVGSPDLPPPQFVMDELSTYAKDPLSYGYTLTGTAEFKTAVSHYYRENYGVKLSPTDETLMLMGSQDGLVHLPMVVTDPNDIILVPDPGYTAYAAGISLAEATPYPMPLKAENNFLPDLSIIPEEVCHKAKLMIINFPGNPVPAMATLDFFKEVVAFAQKYNILVLHDFAYCELYYDQKPISFLSVEGAKDVGIEFNSMSKSFNMAGCRIGFVVGNAEIISGLDRLKSNLDYGVFLPIQKAAIQALRNDSGFTTELRAIYKKRRDVFVNGLSEIGWQVSSPPASMFVWAEVPPGYTSKEFTYKLLDEAGVVVIPGNAFGTQGEGYVRVGIVQPEEVLQKAVNKIKESGILTR
ncbi:LL-diaminopimelate aminotransferase [Bacillus pinisoli]|uniref:LL-diaminopimelate aminotransferase n=1 Tax=Bacillus pinisoli TaxID=2901866 RepID=UPI001FF28416|nr:LL-diaminopimelate aminotransferase [Bacillus pinisoli]